MRRPKHLAYDGLLFATVALVFLFFWDLLELFEEEQDEET